MDPLSGVGTIPKVRVGIWSCFPLQAWLQMENAMQRVLHILYKEFPPFLLKFSGSLYNETSTIVQFIFYFGPLRSAIIF